MVSGKTSNGFEFNFPRKRITNMRFIEALAKAEKGDYFAIADVVTLLLHEDKERLYNFVEDDDGDVDMEIVASMISEMVNINEEVKK